MRPTNTGSPQRNGRCDDISWVCSAPGCNQLLGIIDRATESAFRFRYGQVTIYVTSPEGVSVICKKCGAFNAKVRREPAKPLGERDRPQVKRIGGNEGA